MSYSVIQAPLSGRVMGRYADPGDTAVPGAPLLRLYDPDHLRLEAGVRESLAAGLGTGQRFTARIDALERHFQATVEEIVPAADPGARAFFVKATLPANPKLYPGMFGRLLIPGGMQEQFYVPSAAVSRVGQLYILRRRRTAFAYDRHAS